MSSYLFKHPVVPLSNVNGAVVNVDSSNWPGHFGTTQTSREYALPDNYSYNVNAANASRIANSMIGGGKKRRKTHSIRKKIKNIVNKYRMTFKKNRKQTKRRLMSFFKNKSVKMSKSKGMRKGMNKSMRKSMHKSKSMKMSKWGGNAVLNSPIVSSQNLKLVDGTNAYNNTSGGNMKPVDSVTNPYGISMLGGKRSGHKRSGHNKKKRMQKGGYHQFQSDIPMTPTYSTGGILDAKNLGLANPPPYQVLSNCTNCIDNYNYNTNRGFQFW